MSFETVAPLSETKYLFKLPTRDVVFSEEISEGCSSPKELQLPRVVPVGETKVIGVIPALEDFQKKAPAAKVEFLKKREAAPSFGVMHQQVLQQEQKLMERFSAPELKLTSDFVISMCEKSHKMSHFSANPSIETYLDNDDEITWADIYDEPCIVGPKIVNPRKIFEKTMLDDDV
ncbi:uncharacterized protein MONOS_13499 [Monocercomonoides exilis]|uniref:uncharacterized protein n=1 Tax=Monocercomonoides exilis TaxID=2049356 RepID=UPI00355A647F|nr:hypothetical protein MONOS_13499 [Monocercomonoides exilis]|eukprot:MONOS_13499.1-p1 / transcript=MONOS_13499.1 / gene=MONOS_13499 / organism=Monocercomonoides_exilis_PA203 / gene_product=unspecified product / transcript_product=unspecified product / location=Mono_scaffold00837:3390-4024(-) / protein_length=175 / sequence_SO=supercontig / SO=protein_coding / is_pseudo=false